MTDFRLIFEVQNKMMPILKILIVEIEPGIRNGISRILSNFSVKYPFMDEAVEFEIMEASGGEEAIGILESDRPDILFLSNNLPEIEGFEVQDYIEKKLKSIIVVMIVAYSMSGSAMNTNNNNAYDFILKPFTPRELTLTVENITKRCFSNRTQLAS